ncbi:hypothetical protein WJX77_009445 [Trebouxia sp. C0004]
MAGQERPALAEGEVACTVSEDGELPGPPTVEGLAHAPVSDAHDAREAAASSPAGLEHTQELEQELPSAKRRADQSLQGHGGKRCRVDHTGVTGQSEPVDPALIAQPYVNGKSSSSKSFPVPDSATEHPDSHKRERRPSAEQPRNSRAANQPNHESAAASYHPPQTDAADKPSQHSRPHNSRRDQRRDSSRQRSSSRHPIDGSHHRSSSQRPNGSAPTGHRDSSRHHSQPDSRSQHRGSDRQAGFSDRPAQRDAKPDAHSDPRGSSDARRFPDNSARVHSRDGSRGYRDQDRHRNNRGDERYRHNPSRAVDRRHERPRESDSTRDKRKREEKEDKEAEQEFVAKVEAALQANQVDEDQLIEERRKRRQQILAKHQQEQAPLKGVAPKNSARSTSPTASRPMSHSPQLSSLPQSSTNDHTAPFSPLAHAESSHVQSEPAHEAHVDMLAELPPGGAPKDGAESLSISDDEQYQKLDGDLWQQGQGGGQLGTGTRPAGTLVAPSEEPEVQQAETDDRKVPREAAKEAKEAVAAPAVAAGVGGDGLDMFADNVDAHMFAEDPVAPVGIAPAKKALLDNYDDVEGYYNFQVGEVMDGRYEVFATHGKGVFSTVLRARDLKTEGGVGEVAIKIIRANETMYKAAQTEKIVLRKLSGADPEGRRHCIKLLRTFDYRGHLCMAFEAMDINLRELTKKYGRGIGLNIAAVSKYSAQMLISLYHLRNCGVLHADIKPDNILVSASRTMVKLADFGSAMFSGDNEITPYLVSRFYRAPEVILGLKYDHALDIWSIGSVIYELFTGKILFPGKTNNEMLKLIMDVKGPFPKKMLKKGAFTDRHFEDDPNMSFAMLEEDAVTKRPIRRTIAAPHVKKDFGGLLAGSEGDRKKVTQLADLLERMMALDPDKRITPKDALKHPFIKEPKI